MANPKPLVSSNPQPQDIQFKHFGVMNSGAQSRASLFTSITVNAVLALIIVIIGAATKKVVDQRKLDKLTYVVPLKEKPPEPPKPKIPPPPKLPPPPPPKDLPVPKIKIPDPPKVELPKPVEVKVAPAVPKPVAMPAPPKIQVAAAAPVVVSVKMPAQSASIKNADLHPTAVAMGHPDSLVPAKTGPAVSAVNLNAGFAGMPPANSGRGPVSVATLGGNGQPSGSIGGKSAVAVPGIQKGVIGGTGKPGGNANYTQGPVKVAIGGIPPPAATSVQVAKAPTKTPPTVTYKPSPVYTEEARSAHIEGAVRVHIHVAANGAVTVIGVTSGLGHGLDQSAVQVCQGMKFRPAVDSNGNPTDWDGNVTVSFQLA